MPRPALLQDPARAERVMDRLETALAEGCSIEGACSRAGIGVSTHFEYMERAAADLQAGKESIWTEYADRASRGRRRAEDAALEVVRGAADGFTEVRTEVISSPDGLTTKEIQTTRKDWRAAAWWLERALPQRWGVHQTVHHEGPQRKTWDIPGLVLPGVEGPRTALESAQSDNGDSVALPDAQLEQGAEQGDGTQGASTTDAQPDQAQRAEGDAVDGQGEQHGER